jgi:DNA-directed RNA polymerase specialized sigma24 family protein
MPPSIPTPPVPFSPFPLAPPARAPSNDADRIAPTDAGAYGRLLSDPRVRAYLWARLGPIRIPRAQKEDFVGAVLDALWSRRTDRHPVDSVARMLGLARTILEAKLADHWRHLAVVAKVEVEPAPEGGGPAGELPPLRSITPEERLDAKQRLEHINLIAASIGLTEDDVDVMTMTYEGEASYAELAAARGMTAGALRTRIHRLQSAIRRSWGRRVKRTLLLTVLLLALLVLCALAAMGPARNPPPPAPPPAPTVHRAGPVSPAAPPAAFPPVVPTGPKSRAYTGPAQTAPPRPGLPSVW